MNDGDAAALQHFSDTLQRIGPLRLARPRRDAFKLLGVEDIGGDGPVHGFVRLLPGPILDGDAFFTGFHPETVLAGLVEGEPPVVFAPLQM